MSPACFLNCVQAFGVLKKALATATEELERIEAKKEALVEEQRREEEEERNGVLRIIRRCAHEPKVNPPFNLAI